MAHLLVGTKYREAPFMLLKEDEAQLLARIPDIVAGDAAAIELLARTLVMSGFGMTICGGSYPASQGEHLIAHYIDMLGENLPVAYHGEHIAVTTTTMVALQEKLLAQDSLNVAPSTDTEKDFIAHFGEALGRACWQAWLPKRLDEVKAAALNRKLAADWPGIRATLKAVGRTSAGIARALTQAHAPTSPDAVGIPQDFYREAVLNARKIRDRFTSLDLASATGFLQ
jgi:glycerol-1-phosphate dehydrogenase [NAD(P)+]